MDEFRFIGNFRKHLKVSPEVLVPSGDDAAVIDVTRRGRELFTCDMIVEGTHFDLTQTTLRSAARKAILVNVSDIAAMGGTPKQAVVMVGIPGGTGARAVAGMGRGLKSACDEFGVDLVGGDLVTSKLWAIAVAMTGVPSGKNTVLRSGAKIGDVVVVTGRLGGSILGKHINPIPRVKEADFLANRSRVTAMMDISDGLAGDLRHILRASRVGARLDAEKIPISRQAHRLARIDGKSALTHALTDGEDFELLATMPVTRFDWTIANWPFKLGLAAVGEITPHGLSIADRGRVRKLSEKGFEHH